MQGSRGFVEESLDRYPRFAPHQLLELPDDLSAHLFRAEDGPGERDHDDEHRGQRKQRVEGEGRALRERVVGVPVRDGLGGDLPPERQVAAHRPSRAASDVPLETED